MNAEIMALSRAKKAAFRSGYKEAYNAVRAKLTADIEKAKRNTGMLIAATTQVHLAVVREEADRVPWCKH